MKISAIFVPDAKRRLSPYNGVLQQTLIWATLESRDKQPIWTLKLEGLLPVDNLMAKPVHVSLSLVLSEISDRNQLKTKSSCH